MKYKIKNWEQFQHYKDRNPPWIKLHFEILMSQDWVMISDASKLLAIVCMLIASRDKGCIPADPAFFKRVAHLQKEPSFNELISCGFLEPLADASNCERMQADAIIEKRREETETEESIMSGKPDIAAQNFRKEARSVLSFLNEKVGRRYQPVDANLQMIIARLKEGASVQDCKSVIAKKRREWFTDDRMSQFLRPKTLFNKTNFANYIGELVVEGGGS